MDGAAIILAIGAVVLLLLWTTARQHRRHSQQTDQKLCRSCGAAHPAFADYCRRCGKKL